MPLGMHRIESGMETMPLALHSIDLRMILTSMENVFN